MLVLLPSAQATAHTASANPVFQDLAGVGPNSVHFSNPKVTKNANGTVNFDIGWSPCGNGYGTWDEGVRPQVRGLDADGNPVGSWVNAIFGNWGGYTTSDCSVVNPIHKTNIAGPQGGTYVEFRIVGDSTGVVYARAVDTALFEPPAAPTNLSASLMGGSIVRLAWTDNSSTESSFEIQRSSDPLGFFWHPAGTTTADVVQTHDFGAELETSYRYRVRARTATASSSWSNEASVTTSFLPFAQTFGSCEGGTEARNPTRCQSDPVNSFTGSFTHEETDLELPGIGISFALKRSYNSADGLAGTLGPGWTHSYSVSLTAQPEGDQILRAGDGQQLRFVKLSDGSFAADAGGSSWLATTTAGHRLTRPDQVAYSFDASGKLTRIEERNSQALTLTYDEGGLLATVTDTVGRGVTFTHASGLLASVTLSDGRSVSYDYTSGKLTKATDTRGGMVTYTYDADARLKEVFDQNGNRKVKNTYGAYGRVTEQVDALGETSTFAWVTSTFASTSTLTDAEGGTSKDVYQRGRLVKQIDPLGNEKLYTYDAELDVTSITDPLGNTWTMDYDSRGNLVSRAAPSPLSYVELFTYDSKNNLLTNTNGRGFNSAFTYDAQGNLTTITKPSGVSISIARDDTGLPTSLTDPRGKTTNFHHDAQGNLVRVTSTVGAVTTFGYDTSGRRASVVEPRGNAIGTTPSDYMTTFTYDAGDNPLSVTDPLGHVTTYTYDAAGNRTRRTDAKGNTTGWGYNQANELVTVTAADGTTTTYVYDGTGSLIGRTDAKNHQTTYEYDLARRLTKVTSPIGQHWTYEYDASGNRTKMVDANGNATADATDGTTLYSFDQLNRLTTISYSDGTPDVTFTYDANSNRVGMQDGAGTETYAYDALDRLTTVTRGSGSFSYLYDLGSNITRRTYPDGAIVDLTYDDASRLSSVASAGATTTYGYDLSSNLTQTVLPSGNGYTETRTYDRSGRLTDIRSVKAGSILSRSTYSLDEVGNPVTVETSEGVTSHSYDDLYRLVQTCLPPGCGLGGLFKLSYTYDEVGNRLSEVRSSGTKTYGYNAADQLIAVTGTAGTVSYGYDQNGNQIQEGSRTFSYDSANRMTGTFLGSESVQYQYDGEGKRLQAASTTLVGSDTTNFVWDRNRPLPELVRESSGSGSLLRRYVYGQDLISMNSEGQTSYYHHDGLGSVVNISDSSGNTDRTYTYEPFGSTRSEIATDPLAPENPMKFTGEYMDDPTNLYHLRVRQYSAGDGRFLSLDPLTGLRDEAYMSSYVYANNRPAMFVDPAGKRASPGSGPKFQDWLATEVAQPFVDAWGPYGLFSSGGCANEAEFFTGVGIVAIDLEARAIAANGGLGVGSGLRDQSHHIGSSGSLAEQLLKATTGPKDLGMIALTLTPGLGGAYVAWDAFSACPGFG